MPGSSSLSSHLQNASVLNAAPGLSARVAQPLVALLDFADGTLVRATEAANQDPRDPAIDGTGAYAWAYLEATEAANHLGNNVPRIFRDSAIFIEGARTNDARESWFNTWGLIGSASLATDDAESPDIDSSGQGAATITFTASAADGVNHVTTIAAGVGSDNSSAMISCWLRATSGTEEARIGLLSKDASTLLLSADLTITTTWTRFFFEVVDIGAGVVAPEGRVHNSTDAAARSVEAWGFQVEEASSFASSDIRANDASTPRNLDDLVMAQADIDTRFFVEGFEIFIWPAHASGNIHNDEFIVNGADNIARRRIILDQKTPSESSVVYRANSSTNRTTGNFTFVVGDKITINVQHDGGGGTEEMRVFVNDVEVAGSPVDLSASGSAWSVQDYQFGASTLKTSPFFGVISRPRSL